MLIYIIKVGKLLYEAKCLHLIIGVLTYDIKSEYNVSGIVAIPVNCVCCASCQQDIIQCELASGELFKQTLPSSFCEMSKVLMHLLVYMWFCCVFKSATRNTQI